MCADAVPNLVMIETVDSTKVCEEGIVWGELHAGRAGILTGWSACTTSLPRPLSHYLALLNRLLQIRTSRS